MKNTTNIIKCYSKYLLDKYLNDSALLGALLDTKWIESVQVKSGSEGGAKVGS